MKIHLKQPISYPPEALITWKKENLVIGVVKACDELMLSKKHEQYFTSETTEVTCKKCLQKIIDFSECQTFHFNDQS